MTLLPAQTAWLIPLYPLVAALLSLAWSPGLISRTGPRPSGYLNLLMALLAFGHSLLAMLAFHSQAGSGMEPISFHWLWLSSAGLSIDFAASVSSSALLAMVVITGLHVLTKIYAIGYLEMDWGWPRFFGSLNFFEAGLCALVLTDSLFFSYVILELLTLGTYLIIGTWYNQSLVVKGARDAFLTKRIGDLFLLAGLVALLPITGSWNYRDLATWAATQAPASLPAGFQLILLALVAGPMGKCAQIPLHLWLDEAMEGPLPSTVLRNSVVVAGGAWVLLRLQPLIVLSPVVQAFLVVVGGTTAVAGAADRPGSDRCQTGPLVSGQQLVRAPVHRRGPGQRPGGGPSAAGLSAPHGPADDGGGHGGDRQHLPGPHPAGGVVEPSPPGGPGLSDWHGRPDRDAPLRGVRRPAGTAGAHRRQRPSPASGWPRAAHQWSGGGGVGAGVRPDLGGRPARSRRALRKCCG